MTEAEWLACKDTTPMLKYIEHWGSQRKLRLFACTCCRRFWHKLSDRLRRAVVVAEEYADGEMSNEELSAANAVTDWISDALSPETYQPPVFYATREDASHGAWNSAFYTVYTNEGSEPIRTAAQCTLLRDIFGNPFRPVSIQSAWKTPCVLRLANAIYQQRAFKGMPELADALEQAGCSNTDILTHCRGRGPHVRGCWVLDVILGKKRSMTEAEWTTCDNPKLLLDLVKDRVSDRKLRLFNCFCCRQIRHLMIDEAYARVVELAEQFADGETTADKVVEADQTACLTGSDPLDLMTEWLVKPAIQEAAAMETPYFRASCRAIYLTQSAGYVTVGPETMKTKQCAALRDIIGNPFRPVSLDPFWETPTVAKLARTIYDERAFDRMPELAQALQHAECSNKDVLDHCRQPSEHVRGCWVVDLILAKN